MGGSESNGNIEKNKTSVHTGRNITEPRAPCRAEMGAHALEMETQCGPGVAT